ncbi:MAG TPA: Rne/Rng family ribonuclease, partial [Streptosporangiaceae bacterium]|nr:Rne/Rng family ribonuclease [Streptosporangiaceae bacterium]
MLRRTRRSVTKPAEPPAFRSGAPDAQQETARPAGSGGASGGSQARNRATGPVPVVPSMPAAQPDDRSAAPGRANQPVPAAAFQAPVVVFQPPDLTERRPTESARSQAESSRSQAESSRSQAAPADDSETTGSGPRRRRRGGRGRGKGSGGESGTSQGQGESGAGGAGGAAQGGSGGRAGTAAGGAGATAGAGTADSGAGEQRRGQAERTQTRRAEPSRNQSAAKEAEADKEIEDTEADGEAAADGEATAGSSSRRRRRRRQRSGSGAESDVPAPDDPTDTVVHVREPRPAEPDDVRAVKGSTRLEAKRQRRRESRDTGRRRPPIISESEFLARREAVERVMVVRQQGDRTQIAVLEDGVLVEHYVDKASHQSYVGNVYLGKVQNVLPSMEAAFVDIGKGRNAVLYAGEVNFDATGLEGVAKRIESALKSGQSIMVQVTKDPIGHKGARLTSQISLPGRYLVYVPGASMTGISRKLPDTERTRLKQILKKVAPEEGGIIVRTAAEGASEEELLHDVTRLVAQWQAIERKAKTANAPDLLYGEPDLTIRVVRDIFNEDFTKLVISSDSEWDLVDEYVRYVAPNLSDRLERWSDEAEDDLFAAYRIDEQLAKALDRKVWLPSGGSLVIDTTEAMTVIDVNTGKFTGQGGNLEQTVTRNNLEAAEEIVRQLRLRDIGGIIVIDFIDMVLESNRDLVLRRLIECLARDRTKHQVAEVTSLGLVQMTRKRVGSGLLAAFSVPCEHCNGRGVLISTDLTEVHTHGRVSQLSPPPKPGPGRSRSARSKAIAEVAAKTLDSQQASRDDVAAEPAAAEQVAADGQVQEPATAASADAEPVLAEAATTAPKAAEPRAARSASGRSRRSEPAASQQPAEAEPEPAGVTVEQADAQPRDGESESAASPRRKVRRSAYREAGPPDSALSDGSASSASPEARDAGSTQSPDAAATMTLADATTDAEAAP